MGRGTTLSRIRLPLGLPSLPPVVREGKRETTPAPLQAARDPYPPTNPWHPFARYRGGSVIRRFGDTNLDTTVPLVGQDGILRLAVLNGFKGIRPGLGPLLHSLATRMDFIALQEARFAPNALPHEIPNGWCWDMAAAFSNFGQPTGVATGAVGRATSVEALTSPFPEASATPKMALISTYALDTGQGIQEIDLVNVHGLLGPGITAQIDAIASALESRPNRPTIVAADLNLWWFRETWFRLHRRFEEQTGTRSVENWMEGAPRNVRGGRLEWIFLKGFDVVDARVHDNPRASDHPTLSVGLRAA